MKFLYFGLVGILLLASACVAKEKPLLQDDKDRINYSVGYQIGGDFKIEGMGFNAEALVRGAQDALEEKQPLMTKKEMRAYLTDFQKLIVASQSKQRLEEAAKNLAEGQAFLTENGKKSDVVTLPSGLQYRVVRAGEGQPPKSTDMVTVNYRGTLIDGTEFDSSYHRGLPATFRADRAIKGWKEALQLMKPGSKYELFIPPDLAYGQRGGGSKIGPNRTLIFEVEMISVQPEEEKPAEKP